MELGVLTDPLTKSILLWGGLASLFLGISFAVFAVLFYSSAESRTKSEGALFNKNVSEVNSLKSALCGWIAAGAVVGAFMLLIAGGIQNDPESGCREEENASPGIYRIVNAVLVYNEKAVTDRRGNYIRNEDGSYTYKFTPSHFELQLEGRADPTQDVKITRCITISYPRVESNYKFSEEAPEQKRVPVKTSSLATKVAGGWWKFE